MKTLYADRFALPPFGDLLAAVDDNHALVHLSFRDPSHNARAEDAAFLQALARRGETIVWNPDACAPIRAQLAEYARGERQAFTLPLAPRGTAFQQAVWRELCTIPHGETISYGELARRIGRPTASRAVGAANGANRIAIVIPCHRVIAATGALTGFAFGLDRKRHLLTLENPAL